MVQKQKEVASLSGDTLQVMVGGITFKNKASHLCFEEQKALQNIFPVIEVLPTPVWTLITIFAFGILGSTTNILRQIVVDDRELKDLKYISEPMLGMLTGFIVIGLTAVVPSTLASNHLELKPLSIVFLSLFSGFFTSNFYIYLSNSFSKFFK